MFLEYRIRGTGTRGTLPVRAEYCLPEVPSNPRYSAEPLEYPRLRTRGTADTAVTRYRSPEVRARDTVYSKGTLLSTRRDARV